MIAPPDVKRPESAAARSGRESGSLGRRADRKSTASRPYRVIVIALDRRCEWGRFSTRDEADRIAARLRVHCMAAVVEVAA
jgi:hypothetical protein